MVETEVQFVEDAEQRLLRDLHVLRLRGGRIIEQLSYCTGHWDASAIRAEALDAPMVRP